MSTPQFSITQYLDNSKGFTDEVRKTLFDKGILTKDYPDNNLVLLYHKYDSPVNTDLERECRSLVIDRETLKIVSYSCMTPLLNKEGMDYLLCHSTNQQIINTCYEGTYLSVFNHNGKWYVSTRRCLDSQESTFGQKSHFQMFEDVLKETYPDASEPFNVFTNNLDVTKSYYFVLIHHLNKHVLDYSSLFGNEYKRLCLTSVRDSDMNELDIYNDIVIVDNINNFASWDITSSIFIPAKLDSIDLFAAENKVIKYDKPQSEGIVIRVFDTTKNMNYLIKLQHFSYQFAMVLGQDHNIFKGLIYLYQNDKLIDYFSQNQNIANIKKIVNPLNTTESYDTVGIVDAVFKVCTSELFELFKILWSVKTGKHMNKELYDLLPKEYKDILFGIRGIYYKKKATLFTFKNDSSANEISVINYKASHLKISDVYNQLKTVPVDSFLAFLRMRKLMFNWVKLGNIQDFGKISTFCDKVHMKLCAIFTNKLFPNIMPNDIPPMKEKTA